MKDLKDLFHETLQDVYYAEHAVLKALPKMAKKASTPKLKAAFESHLAETEGQIERLDKVFAALGEKPKATKCDAIEGLLKEAESVMSEAKTAEVMDAGLVSSAQAVEHYEIARYGTLQAWAEQLGMAKVGNLLEETLAQEHACNDTLTQLATGGVNKAADHGGPNGAKSIGKPAAAHPSTARAPAHDADRSHGKSK